MTHTLTIPVDLETLSPNQLGELLRELTFPPKSEDDYGCYTTFEVHPDCEKLSDRMAQELLLSFGGDREVFLGDLRAGYIHPEGYRLSLPGSDTVIEFAWYWDGDGTLCYQLWDTKEGLLYRKIKNTDCKKSYTWEDHDV
jgi:hypothetical protein